MSCHQWKYVSHQSSRRVISFNDNTTHAFAVRDVVWLGALWLIPIHQMIDNFEHSRCSEVQAIYCKAKQIEDNWPTESDWDLELSQSVPATIFSLSLSPTRLVTISFHLILIATVRAVVEFKAVWKCRIEHLAASIYIAMLVGNWGNWQRRRYRGEELGEREKINSKIKSHDTFSILISTASHQPRW